MPVSTGRRGWHYISANPIATGRRGWRFAQDPPAVVAGGPSLFETAWKGGDGTLVVTFDSSGGHSEAIGCATHTLVVAQSESTTQQIQLQMIDPLYQLHPYGEGAHKEALVSGAEVTATVTYGGATKKFFGVFKRPAITRDSSNLPRYTWPGVDTADALFKQKKTLSTLGGNYLSPAPTNRQALTESCVAAGVASDWSGIISTRLGGPFHRQNQTPGDILQQVLDVTVDEWRTEFNKIVGYDPERGGRIWEYDVDLGDCVREHSVQPKENDPILRVKVLRPVATGSFQSTDDVTGYTECNEFGDSNSASFNPPISGATWQYRHRDYRGRASNFIWSRQGVVVAKRASTTPDEFEGLPIWECDSVTWTWGADNEGVTADGVTEAKAGIEFRGKPSALGTIGSGENERGPIDRTTVKYVGDELVDDDDAYELPPNPLLYNEAAMIMHGTRFLRRVGRGQVEHPLRLPLNHLITLGDFIKLKRDSYLGGSGYITLVVIAYQHVISAYKAQRQTTVTGVEYLD